ncbi:MAG: hypothetical protein EOP51_28620, partial [Sphingobacteriales bacterium]
MITGAGTSNFFNVTINKDAAGQTVTNSGNAMSVGGNLTVTTGVLNLDATNANTTITGNMDVASAGRITHNVNWDVSARLLSVGGNINIDGIFNYSVRSHVQMTGSGNKNVRTGTTAGSAFSILSLTTGNYYASGDLRMNDNFWAMFSTAGSFHTNGNNVYANGGALTAGGTLFVDGGTLNVSGGLMTGSGMAGALNISSGTLNTDFFNLGDGTVTGTAAQSGGTFNITGNLTINSSCVFTCTNSPDINVGGNWTSNNNGGFVPANSLVTFNSTSVAQYIQGTATTQNFSTLNINKTGQTLNIAGSTVTINTARININQGTLNAGTATAINLTANWLNNGTYTEGAARVSFNGSVQQTISGSSVTTFNKLTVNNSADILLSATDAVIDGGANALTFTNGKIITGANKLTLSASTTIAGAGAGKYVFGILEWGISRGNVSRVFQIGDAANYTPVNLVFSNVTVTGNIAVFTTGTEHSNILSSQLSENRSVNRIYSVSNTGVSMAGYGATFNFVAGDVDAGAITGQFIVGRYNGGWT